jgi:predicted phage terminase large subunit-like protein
MVDPKVRTKIVRDSHFWFFNIYFSHYVTYPTASFQKEMFEITENDKIKTAVIVAFRGSAKSTIMGLSYPIWAILGKQQKKFILLLSQTQNQARQHMANLKQELEINKVLRADLGPFQESDDEWRSFSIVIPKYGARITAASSEQSIRGIRHSSYRPDLIICDDVEDLNSVKTREGRDKIYRWFTGDVLPTGDKDTKVIMIGNLLHEDSLLLRLKKNIADKKSDGIFKFYPLINATGDITWPGKYPTLDDIETEKRKIGNETAWQREYLLRIISDDEQVVHPEWIHYYDFFPPADKHLYTITGIDLAISEKESADYTAMVSVEVYNIEDELYVYILPNPINERLNFPKTVEKIKILSKSLGNGYPTKLIIEEVGYQGSLIQELQRQQIPAEGFGLKGQDKKARLTLTTHLIQSGRILFPKHGAKELISQLTGFGKEKHDDLADAFAIVILQTMKEDRPVTPEIMIL